MIKCKDFVPRITEQGLFGEPAEYQSFSDVVSTVNQWIENSTIQIMNIQTFVLPNSSESTSDGVYGVPVSNGIYPVLISQGVTIDCFQCVRVWYKE